MQSTRDRIVDAAARIMREKGMAKATTKEIARTAGCSEALLYKHFAAKTDLFIAVLQERTPGYLAAQLTGLRERAGQDTVESILTEVARSAITFFRESFPVAVSIFSEHGLFEAHKKVLLDRGSGPHMVNEWLAGYLRAEQDLGRVRADADPLAAASLLLGACFQHAFLNNFADQPDPATFAPTLAQTLVQSLTTPKSGEGIS